MGAIGGRPPCVAPQAHCFYGRGGLRGRCMQRPYRGLSTVCRAVGAKTTRMAKQKKHVVAAGDPVSPPALCSAAGALFSHKQPQAVCRAVGAKPPGWQNKKKHVVAAGDPVFPPASCSAAGALFSHRHQPATKSGRAIKNNGRMKFFGGGGRNFQKMFVLL